MAELEYSDEAINVLDLFYNVDTILFVEGDDDVVFWDCIFKKLSDLSIKIEPVGGKEEIEKRVSKVIAGSNNVLVAMDSDFSDFDDRIEHQNILSTFGHSIENSIVVSESLYCAIRNIGKIPSEKISEADCKDWLEQLGIELSSLVYHEIQNHLNGSGICIMGDHCGRFMKSQVSPLVSSERVDDHLNNLPFSIDESSEALITSVISSKDRKPKDFVRGHFLFSAAMRFVHSEIKRVSAKKVSISNDSLFGALMIWFEANLDTSHPHSYYYKSIVSEVSVISDKSDV